MSAQAPQTPLDYKGGGPSFQFQHKERALLEVRDLRTYFPIKRGVLSRTVGYVKAVDGVSFDIHPGKTLGLVGESGCGKTTVGRSILRLIAPTSGTIVYRGEDFLAYRGETLRMLRRRMQIIFQDPVSSLNPRMRVGNIVGEPIQVHGIATGVERDKMVAALLERVGLEAGDGVKYPHEFSGGQRQRIGIARALALSPDFIVCDEPVSALDVSIQSQILNLLADLREERKIAYLFIAHNLAVVEHFSDDVAVMYLGRIVEKATARELYANPKHPYTVALLSAVPQPDPRRKHARIVLGGEVPSPANPPRGCPFHPRCHLTRAAAAVINSGAINRDAKDGMIQLQYRGPQSLISLPVMNLGQTTEISSGGQRFSVLTRCAIDQPPLEPKEQNPAHLAACWLTE
jgi:oligopeptide/dipeptide ABC transporter ATP-binding protein